MFDETRPGEVLSEFLLSGIDHDPALVDGNGPDAGGSSIDCQHNCHSERLRSLRGSNGISEVDRCE